MYAGSANDNFENMRNSWNLNYVLDTSDQEIGGGRRGVGPNCNYTITLGMTKLSRYTICPSLVPRPSTRSHRKNLTGHVCGGRGVEVWG